MRHSYLYEIQQTGSCPIIVAMLSEATVKIWGGAEEDLSVDRSMVAPV